MRDDAVQRDTGLEFAGPANEGRHAVGAFPVRVLFAAERHGAGIRPRVVVRTVIRRIQHDCIVRDAEFVEELQELADMHVVLDHTVGILILARDSTQFVFYMRPEVHARAVPPHEPRLARRMLLANELHGPVRRFIVNRLHAFLGQWSRIFAALLPPRAESSRFGLVVFLGCIAVQNAARAEVLEKGLAVGQYPVTRVVFVLRLFFGVQVIQVAEEFVEAVHGRQVLVAIALVVLAELAGRVSLPFQHGRHRDVACLPSFRSPRQTDLGHTRTHRDGPADECSATGRAALLSVIIGERDAFSRDAVDVRRLVSHHATAVVADIPRANVIAPHHQDVRLPALRRLGIRGRKRPCDANQADGCREHLRQCLKFQIHGD